MHEEGQIRVEQLQGLKIGVLGVILDHGDGAPRIVVGAIAMSAIGNREPGVLEKARIVGEPNQMVQGRLGDFDGGYALGDHHGPSAGQVNGQMDFVEQPPIGLADLRPGSRPPVIISLSPQRVEQRVALENTDDGLREPVGIGERDENSAVFGQQLGCCPVGRRDDCLARPDGEGQRAAGQLLAVEIGRDVDVGGTEKVVQLLVIDESIMENHVVLKIKVLDGLLQAKAV